MGPIRSVNALVKSRSITPPGVPRRVSEIPFRMLRVANVATIDGILNPRTNPAFVKPRTRPQSRIAATPTAMWAGVESGPIRKEAITTPRVTMAPTERSR